MKPKIRNLTLAALLTTALTMASTGRAASESDLQAEAHSAIDNFQKADSSLKTYFENSAGYVVFPSVGKGGMVVGGARGKGILYEKGKPIGTATLTQASIGAQ